MSSTYEFQDPGGLQLDSLTDDTSGLRILVNRRGAELASLSRRRPDGKWTGFLYRDADTSTPAEGWKNHATVMGYFIHRLKDDKSVYRGHPIHGGTHSFLRHKDFAAPGVDTWGNSLTYSIGPGQIEAGEYPYKVRLNLTYTLAVSIGGPELLVTFEFQNLENEISTHVSFGLHPGFAVASLAGASVILPKGIYIRHMAPGNFLSGETVRIQHPGGPMPFAKEELPGSFILGIEEVPEAIFAVEDPEGRRRTELDYREAPYITIWSDGHDFICVEPCWGLPDHEQQRPFEEKEGLEEIAPGKVLTRSFSILPEVLQ